MIKRLTEEQQAERAVLSVMKDWPLEPGQMLFMGPKSVAKLSVVNGYDGSLPDTFVVDKYEWNMERKDSVRKRR